MKISFVNGLRVALIVLTTTFPTVFSANLAMASAACDYVGSYILKMDDWNDGNVNITCEGDIANATVVIPEHKVKASSVELTITGNKVKLEMKSDGRRVTIKLSGNRERLTGTVKFKYRNGPGYGRGGASMTPVE